MYKYIFTHVHPYTYKHTNVCTYTRMHAHTHMYNYSYTAYTSVLRILRTSSQTGGSTEHAYFAILQCYLEIADCAIDRRILSVSLLTFCQM